MAETHNGIPLAHATHVAMSNSSKLVHVISPLTSISNAKCYHVSSVQSTTHHWHITIIIDKVEIESVKMKMSMVWYCMRSSVCVSGVICIKINHQSLYHMMDS